MTAGEKIQQYRKQLKISQEELGKQLLVSRQTVSLWEKDQTLPSIDNLIRLREIFGVTIDDLLDCENKENVLKAEPNETYQFEFTEKELHEVFRLQRIYKSIIRLSLASVLLFLFLILTSAPDLITGFTFGALFIGFGSRINAIRTQKKVWKKSLKRICESTYEYKLFEDYIEIGIYRQNERIRVSKCYYTDIEQIQQFEKWIVFQFGGQSFIARKGDLKENSAFYSFMQKNPAKTVVSIAPPHIKVISNLLFVASILTILCAIILVGIVSSTNGLFKENMWLFFLFTPIPISSIILGYIQKEKGRGCTKNIIVGFIITILLCIYGSFTFII